MTLSDPKVSSFHSPSTHDLRTMNNPLVAQSIKVSKNVSFESYSAAIDSIEQTA